MPLQDRERILFIGNSITDTGRNRDVPQPNQPGALGCGYALFTAARLLADHCGRQLEIYNRGVGGHTTAQGLDRFQEDVLPLLPGLVLLEFGFNDANTRDWARKTRVGIDEFAANLAEFHRAITERGGRSAFILNHTIDR
ncbi:MAG: GDSL-type esterase/lipase family protein, partial [Phycisphaeraceae bacterium]